MNARIHKKSRGFPRRPSPAGFTLIEVLVVLALTLVMMSLFATIFSMTGTFVTKQKGIGENDQSARILTTVLKTDLPICTMRPLGPFIPTIHGRRNVEHKLSLSRQFAPGWRSGHLLPWGGTQFFGLDSTNYYDVASQWDTADTTAGKNAVLDRLPPRRAMILLTNVISFDVKIWDNHYSEVTTTGTQFDWNRNGIIDSGPAFADVGHLAASGDFQQANNIFPVYGPNVETPYAVPGAGVWAPTYTYPSNGRQHSTAQWPLMLRFRWYNYDNLPLSL